MGWRSCNVLLCWKYKEIGVFHFFCFLFWVELIFSVCSLERYCHFDHFTQNNRKTKSWVDWSKKSSTESSSNQPVQWDGIDFWRIRPWEAAKVKAFWHHLPSITSRCGYIPLETWSHKKSGYLRYPTLLFPTKLSTFFWIISIFIRQRGSNRNHIYVVNKGDLSFPHKNNENSKTRAISQVCARGNLRVFSGQHKRMVMEKSTSFAWRKKWKLGGLGFFIIFPHCHANLPGLIHFRKLSCLAEGGSSQVSIASGSSHKLGWGHTLAQLDTCSSCGRLAGSAQFQLQKNSGDISRLGTSSRI